VSSWSRDINIITKNKGGNLIGGNCEVQGEVWHSWGGLGAWSQENFGWILVEAVYYRTNVVASYACSFRKWSTRLLLRVANPVQQYIGQKAWVGLGIAVVIPDKITIAMYI